LSRIFRNVILTLCLSNLVLFSASSAEKKENKIKKSDEVSKKTRKSRSKKFAQPVSYDEIKHAIKTVSQRDIMHEAGLESSIMRNKTTVSASGVSLSDTVNIYSVDLLYYYVYNSFFEPGISISYLKAEGVTRSDFRMRVLWNFKDIYLDRLVPFFMLGTGYCDMYVDSGSQRYTGYYLPDAKVGLRYFVAANMALNMSYGYEAATLKSSDAEAEYKMLETGLSVGISLFFFFLINKYIALHTIFLYIRALLRYIVSDIKSKCW